MGSAPSAPGEHHHMYAHRKGVQADNGPLSLAHAATLAAATQRCLDGLPGEPFAVGVADPLLPGCPLLARSGAYEQATGDPGGTAGLPLLREGWDPAGAERVAKVCAACRAGRVPADLVLEQEQRGRDGSCVVVFLLHAEVFAGRPYLWCLRTQAEPAPERRGSRYAPDAHALAREACHKVWNTDAGLGMRAARQRVLHERARQQRFHQELKEPSFEEMFFTGVLDAKAQHPLSP